MSTEETGLLQRRALRYAALGDPARLRLVEMLTVGDLSPSEVAEELDMPSNLLAHHLRVLEQAGIVDRQRSQGDRRRTYLSLSPSALDTLAGPSFLSRRVVFVCTANSARSQLAAALWRQTSTIPAASAGTHPASRIDTGAIDTARRHDLPLPRIRPQHLDDIQIDGDLVVTVCDLAHEELPGELHWSIPDPTSVGTQAAFDAAYDELARRVTTLAPRLAPAS